MNTVPPFPLLNRLLFLLNMFLPLLSMSLSFSSLFPSLFLLHFPLGWVDLVEELDVVVVADDVLLDLLGQFLDGLLGTDVDELVDHCRVLLPLALLEGDYAVLRSVGLHQG